MGSSESRSAGIGLRAALRAEKRQMRYLISQVFVLKRRRRGGENIWMVRTGYLHFALGIE
jgi:hypothetical protein